MICVAWHLTAAGRDYHASTPAEYHQTLQRIRAEHGNEIEITIFATCSIEEYQTMYTYRIRGSGFLYENLSEQDYFTIAHKLIAEKKTFFVKAYNGQEYCANNQWVSEAIERLPKAICIGCKKTFPRTYAGAGTRAKYCSSECRYQTTLKRQALNARKDRVQNELLRVYKHVNGKES